eukprot:GHVU01085452.1.p1 GENE.GHVU01085452.1~~GHVU01085452.1.p1  ORF type:complete len:154 (+),score=24.19 GHVU01085452.1:344-805(+)
MSDPPSFDDMPSGAACQICFEDFSEANYAKYTTANNDKTWHGSLFCSDCIKRLIETQFGVYCKEIQQTDCMKTLRSLLERGPPINVRDKYGFPEAGDEEVGLLCFSSDKAVHPAKLKDSVTGPERMALWESQKKIMESQLEAKEKADEQSLKS